MSPLTDVPGRHRASDGNLYRRPHSGQVGAENSPHHLSINTVPLDRLPRSLFLGEGALM